jgi:hypothetical protein
MSARISLGMSQSVSGEVRIFLAGGSMATREVAVSSLLPRCVLSTSLPRNRFSFLGRAARTFANQPLGFVALRAAPNPIDGKLRLLRRLLWSRREG